MANKLYDYMGNLVDITDDSFTTAGVPADSKITGDIIGNRNIVANAVFTIRRESMWGRYRFCALSYDTKNGYFYLVGGNFDRDGTSKLAKFSDIRNPLKDITYASLTTGHSNDMTYDPVNDRLIIAGGIAKNDGSTENQYSNYAFFVDPETMAVTGSKNFGYVVQGVEAAEGDIYVWSSSSGTYTIRLFDSTLTTVKSTGSLTKTQLVNYLNVNNEGTLYAQGITYDNITKKLYWCISRRDDYLPSVSNFISGVLAEIDTSTYQLIHVLNFPVDSTEEFQSAVFANGILYAVCDVYYGIFRVFDPKTPMPKCREWIPSNSDLNNYLTVGEYFSDWQQTAQTYSNSPTQYGFTMKVEQIGQYDRKQTIYSNMDELFVRRYLYSSDSWTDWKQIPVEEITLN